MLIIDCLKCGSCCRVLAFPISSREEHIFYKTRGLTIRSGWVIIPSTCQYLVDNKCLIHDRKPLSCKLFRPYSLLCRICKEI